VIRFAPLEGPSKVGVSLPSPEDGNTSSFRDVVFSSCLEFWTMDKVHKPSHSDKGSNSNKRYPNLIVLCSVANAFLIC
jgi:hypothetical protein